MNDTTRQVWDALDTYTSAVLAKDVDAFMRLYDPAVRVFDTWGTWSHEGAATWKAAIDGWFSSLGSDDCAVTFDEVRITEAGATAAMSAIVTYTAQSAQGQAIRTMQNRITWVLENAGDGVRVVHEHTSVPVGPDDGKAILGQGSA